LVCRPEGIEPQKNFCHRVIPRDFLEGTATASAGSSERLPDTIRMIGHLNACLAPGADFSVADGVLRVALQLFRETHFQESLFAIPDHFGFTVHHADVQSTSRRTE
jgi:hypothetical protein